MKTIEFQISFFLCLLIYIPAFGIDDAFKAGKDNKGSEELMREEKLLDARIIELCERLQSLYTLRGIESRITRSPNRTAFNTGKDEDGDFVELIAYTLIPGVHNRGKPVGTNSKLMRLYFSGKELTKIKTIVDDRNFQDQSRHFTKAVHSAPVKSSPNDIQLSRSENIRDETSEKKPGYQQTLKYFENDSSNPTRNKFKRDFYIPNLTIFENLFRQTFELQKQNASNTDLVTIQRMRRSLK